MEGFCEEVSCLLGLASEKNKMVIVKIKHNKENVNKSAHIRGCICGIKEYPVDNLGLTSLGYFLTNSLRLENSFDKIFWVDSF